MPRASEHSTLDIDPDTPGLGRRTLAEAAAAELHRMIITGQLSPAEPLRLNELADRLQISHMPIREALRRLEAIGLVDVVPHKGAYIRPLNRADFADTNETRLVLESAVVAKTAERRDPESLDRAERAFREHERLLDLGDLPAARKAHTDFHFALYYGSGSWWLPRAIEPVWQNSERYRFSLPSDPKRRKQASKEHAAILAACRAGDPHAASAALRQHLERAGQRVLSLLPGDG